MNVFRCLFLAIALLSFDSKAQDIRYRTTLVIIPCAEHVCLKILTLNHSARPMYFPPGERLVEIRNSKGKKIHLNGPIVESPMVEFSEYQKIEKGEVREEMLDLSRSYQIANHGWYTVHVSNSYFDREQERSYKRPDSVVRFLVK